MAEPITIKLPSEVKHSLQSFSQKEGISQDDVVGQAIKEHLFLTQFRSLRQRLVANAQSQGVLADQDVFDRVS